jgi:hypothetical protein
MPPQIEQQSLSDLTIAVSKSELAVAYDRRASSEYVFPVRITNHSYAHLEVCKFRAGMPWKRRLFLLADTQPYSPEMEGYRLESGRTFPRMEVLNHRMGECGGLGPGESMEGVLLGLQIFCRIPFDYLHGTIVPAEISVVDQFGRRHGSEIEVRIDRSATMRPLIRRPRGTSLFEDADAPPVDFSLYEPRQSNSWKHEDGADNVSKNHEIDQ